MHLVVRCWVDFLLPAFVGDRVSKCVLRTFKVTQNNTETDSSLQKVHGDREVGEQLGSEKGRT